MAFTVHSTVLSLHCETRLSTRELKMNCCFSLDKKSAAMNDLSHVSNPRRNTANTRDIHRFHRDLNSDRWIQSPEC